MKNFFSKVPREVDTAEKRLDIINNGEGQLLEPCDFSNEFDRDPNGNINDEKINNASPQHYNDGLLSSDEFDDPEFTKVYNDINLNNSIEAASPNKTMIKDPNTTEESHGRLMVATTPDKLISSTRRNNSHKAKNHVSISKIQINSDAVNGIKADHNNTVGNKKSSSSTKKYSSFDDDKDDILTFSKKQRTEHKPKNSNLSTINTNSSGLSPKLLYNLKSKSTINVPLRVKTIQKLQAEYKKMKLKDYERRGFVAESDFFDNSATKASYLHNIMKFVQNLHRCADQSSISGDDKSKSANSNAVKSSTDRSKIPSVSIDDNLLQSPEKRGKFFEGLSRSELDVEKLLSLVASQDELLENGYPIYDQKANTIVVQPSRYTRDLKKGLLISSNKDFIL